MPTSACREVSPCYRASLRTAGEVTAGIGERCVDVRRQRGHASDAGQSNDHDQEDIFHQVLAFLFPPQTHEKVLHSFFLSDLDRVEQGGPPRRGVKHLKNHSDLVKIPSYGNDSMKFMVTA